MPSVATAALLQNRIGVPEIRSTTASTAPLVVSTRSTPRCASQTSSRPSRSISSPSGRPEVCATRSTCCPSGLSRKIEPSSVPVKTEPSWGPVVATTTSSAPWAGTAWTVKLIGVLLG